MGVNDLLDRYQVGTQQDKPKLQDQHTEPQRNITETKPKRRSVNQQDNRSSRNGLSRETLSGLQDDGIGDWTGHGPIYGKPARMSLETEPDPLEGIITGPKAETTVESARDRLGWFRDLTSRLPESWGIDLTLILLTLAGVLLILFHLPAVLLFIARAIFSIFELGMVFALLLSIIVGLIIIIRRRRRW